MDVLRVDPYLFVVRNEFDRSVDIESIPIEVDEEGMVEDDRIDDGTVTLNSRDIIARGRTIEGAVDNYEAIWEDIEQEYPDIGPDHEPINSVFSAYVSLDEDESVEELREYVSELDGVDNGIHISERDLAIDVSVVDVDFSPVGFENVEIPEEMTHRIVIVGFDGDVDGSYETYLEEYLRDF